MTAETINVEKRKSPSMYEYDFGRFPSKTRIRVSSKFWDEYVATRCRFVILHAILIEHVESKSKKVLK